MYIETKRITLAMSSHEVAMLSNVLYAAISNQPLRNDEVCQQDLPTFAADLRKGLLDITAQREI